MYGIFTYIWLIFMVKYGSNPLGNKGHIPEKKQRLSHPKVMENSVQMMFRKQTNGVFVQVLR